MPNGDEATLVAALLAIDPALGGAVLRSRDPTLARDWVATLGMLRGSGVPARRLPVNISDDRLVGGLDLTASLVARRRVAAKGLLAEASGGTIIVPFVDALAANVVWHVAAALDAGEVIVERDGVTRRDTASVLVIALAEPVDQLDDAGADIPGSWRDRLAFDIAVEHACLPNDALIAAVAVARERSPSIAQPDTAVEALCRAAEALGVRSLRASRFALRAARAHAALVGRTMVTDEDLIVAARFVLAPRATAISPEPQPGEASAPDEDVRSPDDAAQAPSNAARPEDADVSSPPDSPGEAARATESIVAAVHAALPAGLVFRSSSSRPGKARAAGRSGAERASAQRGRQIGVRRGDARAGRLDVIATLKAAAPWQRMRHASAPNATGASRTIVLRDDFRLRRYRQRASTTTIFVVDASGSAARARMAEAKGAVELLLTESYARRDRVSLIAFGGRSARCLLPPTRALARARRELAGLAAGGGTPLSSALDLAHAAAASAIAEGDAMVVVLTDGGANVARDGTHGRERAMREALDSAKRFRSAAADSLVIDCGVRASAGARSVASAMGARYVWLARASARAMRDAVTAVRRDVGPNESRA